MGRIIDLHEGRPLRLDAAAGTRLQVLLGTVWLTEPGRLDDVFAHSGDEVVLLHGGHVLVEGHGFARLIVPAARQRFSLAALAAWLRALRRRLPVPALSAT